MLLLVVPGLHSTVTFAVACLQNDCLCEKSTDLCAWIVREAFSVLLVEFAFFALLILCSCLAALAALAVVASVASVASDFAASVDLVSASAAWVALAVLIVSLFLRALNPEEQCVLSMA